MDGIISERKSEGEYAEFSRKMLDMSFKDFNETYIDGVEVYDDMMPMDHVCDLPGAYKKYQKKCRNEYDARLRPRNLLVYYMDWKMDKLALEIKNLQVKPKMLEISVQTEVSVPSSWKIKSHGVPKKDA